MRKHCIGWKKKNINKFPVTMPHACNSSYSRDKEEKDHSLRSNWGWWHDPSYLQGYRQEDCSLRTAQKNPQEPTWKISRQKWLGYMVQVAENLPRKHKALTANTITTKNISKIYKHAVRFWENKEGHKILITERKRDVTTYSMNIKRITQEYYEQLHVHTFDRLCKMEQFHKKHSLSKFIS
jgi:hypothetical protein